MDDPLDYRLNDIDEKDLKLEKKQSKKKLLIVLIIIISIIILAGVGVILYFFIFKGKPFIKKDVPIDVNGKIPNSFKRGGANYNDIIGNLNGGQDFDINERNYFDYCIPERVKGRKNKHNILYLQVHGGGWIGGNKEDINLFCDLNANNSDAITVVMTHTLLNGTHNQSSIFRILDEITATITKVREELKEQGFNISKLELAMHGSSSGAHIVSLYSFLIKNHPMEIKFITNTVGPMSVSPYDYLICKNESETLSSIEPEDIEEAKKNGTVGFLNGNDEFHYSQFKLLNDMNIFFGKKYDDNINEMYDWDKQEIKYDSQTFIELLKKAEYAFPHTHINKDSPPMFCTYGGNDTAVGIGQYAKLKTAYKNAGIVDRIELVYCRYGNHDLGGFDTEYGQENMARASEGKYKMMKKIFKSFQE